MLPENYMPYQTRRRNEHIAVSLDLIRHPEIGKLIPAATGMMDNCDKHIDFSCDVIETAQNPIRNGYVSDQCNTSANRFQTYGSKESIVMPRSDDPAVSSNLLTPSDV